MEILNRINAIASPAVRKRVLDSVNLTLHTLERYGPDGVALSFNGGKDSTVLLHLLRAARSLYFLNFSKIRSDSKIGPTCRSDRPQGFSNVFDDSLFSHHALKFPLVNDQKSSVRLSEVDGNFVVLWKLQGEESRAQNDDASVQLQDSTNLLIDKSYSMRYIHLRNLFERDEGRNVKKIPSEICTEDVQNGIYQGVSTEGRNTCSCLGTLSTSSTSSRTPSVCTALSSRSEGREEGGVVVEKDGEREREKEQGSILTIYFEDELTFPEISAFTKVTAKRYCLCLEMIPNGDFKEGMSKMLKKYPTLVAVLLGTRDGDPNSSGQFRVSPSSEGWPSFLRINPIIDWTYDEVWTFLLCARVPYCCLYDQGYTSIGNVLDTVPNEALRVFKNSNNQNVDRTSDSYPCPTDSSTFSNATEGRKNSKKHDNEVPAPTINDSSHYCYYLPAHLLKDGSLERAGRPVKKR